jgi:hypothetical protein
MFRKSVNPIVRNVNARKARSLGLALAGRPFGNAVRLIRRAEGFRGADAVQRLIICLRQEIPTYSLGSPPGGSMSWRSLVARDSDRHEEIGPKSRSIALLGSTIDPTLRRPTRQLALRRRLSTPSLLQLTANLFLRRDYGREPLPRRGRASNLHKRPPRRSKLSSTFFRTPTAEAVTSSR